MTLYVTEYPNVARLLRGGIVLPSLPLAAYALSSLSTSPALNALTDFIRVTADAGMLCAISSSSAQGGLTSTNATRLPPNAPAELWAVPQGATRYVIAMST